MANARDVIRRATAGDSRMERRARAVAVAGVFGSDLDLLDSREARQADAIRQLIDILDGRAELLDAIESDPAVAADYRLTGHVAKIESLLTQIEGHLGIHDPIGLEEPGVVVAPTRVRMAVRMLRSLARRLRSLALARRMSSTASAAALDLARVLDELARHVAQIDTDVDTHVDVPTVLFASPPAARSIAAHAPPAGPQPVPFIGEVTAA